MKCDGRCESHHECQGEIKRVHVMLGSKDWGRYNYCDEARAEDKRNGYTVLFENVSCSQCGRDFGEGKHGFSHCSDHSPECAECGHSLRHERMRFFEDGACHVWSCGNEACSKWNLIKNTEADSQHNIS